MVVSFIVALTAILATHLLLIGALAGLGFGVQRVLGVRHITLDDCFAAFWIGFGAAMLLLLVWNLVYPVNAGPLLIVLALGATGLIVSRGALARLFAGDAWRPPRWLAVLLVAVALFVAMLSMAPLVNYDSSLYHIQGMLWAARYPAVPGLANLYGPLGFNNGGFLYDAMLSVGPWTDRSNHVANGLLVHAMLVQAIVGGARFAGAARRARDLFNFVLLAPVADLLVGDGLTSLNTDYPASLAILAATAALYGALGDAAVSAPSPSSRTIHPVPVAIMLGAAVVSKMNAAVFAAATFVVTVWLLVRRRASSGERVARPVGWAIAIAAAMGTAWMGRGVVLSGYPGFPSSVAGVAVDWRAPAELADAEFAYIVHSGRGSTQNLPVVAGEAGAAAWFPRWWSQVADNPFDVVVPSGIALALALLFVTARRRAPPGWHRSHAWWMAVPCAVAIIAWYFAAPAPRYIAPIFWSLAALAASETWRLSNAAAAASGTPLPVRRWLAPGVLVGLAPLVVSPVLRASRADDGASPLVALAKAYVTRPSGRWFPRMAQPPQYVPFTTASGLVVNVPKDQCWMTPIPCTPNPAVNLRLRRPPHLRHGFVTDGAWQMQNWPLSWQPAFLDAWRRSRRGARPGS
jgi:hypothetical protein